MKTLIRTTRRSFSPSPVQGIKGTGPFFDERIETHGRKTDQSPVVRQCSSKRRAGTTLTEVLISILIMSFGIATVATLFPISALRSAQAVKLTNATILRYNAESLIDMEPALIHNPDYDSGPTSLTEHTSENFIVDPLGWHMMPSTPAAAPLRDYFGNDGNGAAVTFLRRYRGNPVRIATLADAESYVTLPDSWTLLNEGTIAAAGPSGGPITDITLSSDTDITDLSTIVAAGSLVRLNIFSVDGRFAQSRELTAANTTIAGQQITWNTSEPQPLPAYMPAAQLGRAQLEVQERRYTWLLTVRKESIGAVPNAAVDIVVFFKRDLTEADETLYQASFVKNQADATITYNSSIEVPFKKGHWVLDANNGHWYRVQDISDPPVVSGSSASVTITLDRPAADASPAGGLGRAMFPRGVVDVYPIGTKAYVP